MKPIYNPKGAAKEYCEWALNIYTGCPHRCFYCYCLQVLRRDAEEFFTRVEPRKNIVEETRKQLEREHITGKLIQLCFIGDPYPTGYDTTPTREIIALLKAYGNHVQILTKGDGTRDFDLLDEKDWYGITLDGKTVVSAGCPPIFQIRRAKEHGIKTWVSFEPVLDDVRVLWLIEAMAPMVDKVKIGKLNYHHSDINWKQFGHEAEALCQRLGLDYTIKDGLRAEMEK